MDRYLPSSLVAELNAIMAMATATALAMAMVMVMEAPRKAIYMVEALRQAS